MMINEIVIYIDCCPNYNQIENLFIKILEIESNDLSIKYTMMDDWFFTNEKKVSVIDTKNLSDKICRIELFENKSSRGIITIEKNDGIYQIDMYARNNFIHKVDLQFVENVKQIFNSFRFIAIGDDFLIGEGNDIKNIISSSSGVELWIFPFDNDKKIIQKLNLLNEAI